MKGGECKVPIQEDQRGFLDKQKIEAFPGSKKLAIISAFLLLIAMSLMTAFTFQSLNGISELRQEVEALKASIKALQKKIDENEVQNGSRGAANILKDDYHDFDYTYGDYEDEPEMLYDMTANDDNYEDNSPEQYTIEEKLSTVSPKNKRSIIGNAQDGTALNSETQNEARRRNSTFKKNQFTTPPPSSYSYPFYPERYQETTPAPRQIHSKRMRVYHDDSSQNVRRIKTASLVKAGDSQDSQENRDVEFTVVADDHLGGRGRHRQRRLEFDDRHVKTGRMRPLPAAHFSGDTSKYVLGQHDNFNGNGHLRHLQRTFVDWTEGNWFRTLGMDRHFSLTDGLLTIKEPGLYFIYAQIYYYDEHDINGFRVYRNENETLLQCTTTTHSVERVMKGNTCFTAGVEYLNENDRISVGDLSESRYSLFEPGKSFFGIIKLGDVKIK